MITITLTDNHITCAKDIIQLKEHLILSYKTHDITIEHNHATQEYKITLNNITLPK